MAQTPLWSLVWRGGCFRSSWKKRNLGFSGSGVQLSNHPLSSPWEESQAYGEGHLWKVALGYPGLGQRTMAGAGGRGAPELSLPSEDPISLNGHHRAGW